MCSSDLEKRVKKSRKPSEYNKFIGNMRRSGLSMGAAQKAYRERHAKDDRDYDVGGMFDSPKGDDIQVKKDLGKFDFKYRMGCRRR